MLKKMLLAAVILTSVACGQPDSQVETTSETKQASFPYAVTYQEKGKNPRTVRYPTFSTGWAGWGACRAWAAACIYRNACSCTKNF